MPVHLGDPVSVLADSRPDAAAQAGLVARLSATADAGERVRLLPPRASWTPDLVHHLADESARLTRIDLEQAARVAEAADLIATDLGDAGARARSLRAAGHVHALHRRHHHALECYTRSRTLSLRAGSELDAAVTMSGALQTLIYAGRYTQAHQWAAEARRTFTLRHDTVRLARLDSNLGNVFFRQDRFDEALAHYERACTTFDRIGATEDAAIALRNLAVCHVSLGDFPRALRAYRRARRYCSRHGMALMVVKADYNIAYLAFLRGEYTRAIDAYAAVRARALAAGDGYHAALCDLDLAELYLEINLYDEAARLAARARTCFESLSMQYECGKAIAFLALATSHHGDIAKALPLFGQARRLFVAERNRMWPALIDVYRGIVVHRAGRPRTALSLAARALHVFSQSPLSNRAALAELLIARLQLEAGELASARRSVASALARLERTEAPALQCQAHTLLGRVHEAAGDRAGASVAFRRARLDLEAMRSRLHGDDLKVAFLKDKLTVYESLVSMCLAQGTPKAIRTAFGYIEEAKSRALADLIAFGADALPEPTGGPTDTVRELRESRARLVWLSRPLHHGDPSRPDQRTGGERARAAVRRERWHLDDLVARLRQQDPELAALQEAGTVGVQQIRTVLPPGGTLLEYYETAGRLHASVLTRSQLHIVPVAAVDDVRRSMRLLQLQIAKWQLDAGYTHAFAQVLEQATRAHLRDLYDALLAPVRQLLRGRHLVVVPHGLLHGVPFHALHHRGRFLVDDFAISYAPSATVYYLCAIRPPVGGNRALVLGVPDPNAPRIREEVRDVAACFEAAEVLMGRRASRHRLTRAGPGCGVIHIATHGHFRRDNPMFSSVRLGDGELRLMDLYALRLPADLVTLSGCGTGLGVVDGGDELLGLTRGLLHAGARSVLVSLWDVHDSSTARLMTLFYREVRTTRDRAIALQRAVLALKRELPHPYHWAPFLLVGPAGPPPRLP